MVRLKCPSCQFAIVASNREAERGMQCPECHCGRLFVQRKERRGRRVVSVRIGTVRFLVAGGVGILAGPILLALGIAHLGDRAAVLWARAVAGGALLTLAGIGALIAGIVGLYRDLR